MTAADQPTTEPGTLGTDRDTLARLIARAQDADSFYDDIEAWEDQEDWEREAHPDNYPDMAYEDRAEYEGIADRLIVMLGLLAPAPQPAADTETEVQWGVRDDVSVTPCGDGEQMARDYVTFVDSTATVVKCTATITTTVTRTPWEEA